jgi:HEAT repeat protein
MLSDTIDKYLKLFKESPNSHESSTISSEMRRELQNLPSSEVIQELEKYALNPKYSGLNSENHNGLHENVVEILDKLRDERAIPALSKALTYRWSYDEWLNVPRKSLLALSEIGTPEAMMIIKEATQSPEELIREDATMILENW